MELKVNKEKVKAFNDKLEAMRKVCEKHFNSTADAEMFLNAYNIFNDITNKLQMNELVLDSKNLMEFIKGQVKAQVDQELSNKKGTN